MPLSAGTRLGSYEIVSALGAGGMGEVYRARDPNLGRDVAIKVLPAAVSADPERLARFEREARVLASLNHPNIAHIYGLDRQKRPDGRSGSFIVMELVGGETLDARIAKQRRVPGESRGLDVADALSIARQVAEALEAAHEQGIVHRDLKPANIKLRPDGTVKVLDFGLAKGAGDAGTPEGGREDLSRSPTVVAPTMDGALLGTAPYMSPEQARGRAVDKRADVWAFGCVLYEMLTGRQAFIGPTISDVVAAILEREPRFEWLPQTTPVSIRRLLRRCLEKDVKKRLCDLGDARIEIDDALTRTGEEQTGVVTRRGLTPAAAFAALFVATAVASGLVVWTLKPRAAPAAVAAKPGVARVALIPAEVLADAEEAVAVSPDGRRIAYIAGTPNRRRIYVREIDRYEGAPVPGTDGADGVVFSDDGRSIAFLADRKLKTVALGGGLPLTVRDSILGRGFDWAADGSLLFNPGASMGIWRVRPENETTEMLTKLNPHEDQHRFPKLLPGGRAILYSGFSGGGLADDQVYVHIFETGQNRPLVKGTGAQYLPTGHLVYVRGGSLFAVRFDLLTFELKGNPVVVLDGVRQSATGTPHISFSRDGTMVYVSGRPVSGQRTLVWVDREGVERPAAISDRPIAQPRLSVDGRRIAVVAKGEPDLWQLDLTRDAWTRLTFDGNTSFPLWTQDGRHLVFSSGKDGPYAIHWRTIDGSGSDERLLGADRSSYPLASSPDGRLLAFVSINAETAQDIWLLDTRDRGQPRPLLRTRFREGAPVFSPDGRWLAYVSDESGRPEIYIRPVEGPGETLIVSSGGGLEPVWPRKGRELFYRSGNALMAVEVTPGAAMVAGKPRRLFQGSYEHSAAFWPDYDADSDSRRFLMIKSDDPASAPVEIRVVMNWFEELNARVPGK